MDRVIRYGKYGMDTRYGSKDGPKGAILDKGVSKWVSGRDGSQDVSKGTILDRGASTWVSGWVQRHDPR